MFSSSVKFHKLRGFSTASRGRMEDEEKHRGVVAARAERDLVDDLRALENMLTV